MSQLDTGDVLLFESNYTGSFGWWAKIVSFVTGSKWTHVALILKDPVYIDKSYRGLYVLECGSEEWADKWGVIVSPYEKVVSDTSHKRISCRKLETNIDLSEDKLKVIWNTIEGKQYDTNPIELVAIQLRNRWLANPRKLDKFVCSTLVAYVYTALGFLPRETNWFFFEPWHFSDANTKLQTQNCLLGKEISIKNNT